MISRYLIAATFALSASALWGKETNPPAGKAGDPPSSQNCTDCHDDGALNNGDSNFTIIGLPSFYTPSRTYELNLLLDKNATGYGFQAIAKDVNNTAGSFTPVSSGITVDGEYIEHNTPSTTGQWTFKWTAPSTDVGLVTFYASGLVANSNGAKTGDSVYTLTVDMNSSSSQNIPQVQDLVWSQPTRGAIYSSPTIGSDGTIYVGSGDDNLYAFYPDGGIKWTYQAGEWVDSTPAIADDGTVYVGSWDNKLHAINPDGTSKWTFSTDSLVLAGPAVGPDGTIYVGSHDNFFYALEANGSVKWEYFAEQPVSSSAALGQDGTIYFGDDNGTFHAVNPDGTSKWTYVVDTISESNSSIESSPALDLYGYIYFGSANGYCYSLEDNGTNGVLRWKYATADRVDSSPVIGLSNEVFFMSRDGYLRSIDIDFGVTNWEKPIGDVFYSSPVVDENGTVYVVGYLGGGENHIFAIDANGSMDWNSSMTNHSVVIGDVVDSSLAIDANGTLYFGSFDKKLYAVKAGWNLADSDWPKFRRDNSGTGRWPSYQIDANASPVGSGTIAGAGVHNQGATASLTATPATGYSFSHWSGDSNETNATISLAATQHRSVTAHFTLNSYTLTATGGTGGSVSGAGVFNYGTVAAISATTNNGYTFTGWTGDGIADLNASNTTVLITQDRNVTATFTINRHTLIASGGVGGSVSGAGTFDWNSSAPISATINTGYTFTGWVGTGIGSPSDANTTVLMTEDRNVSATFLINSYALSISTETTGGSVSSSGSHNHGTQASITATPQTGYSFIGWTGEGIADLNASTTTVDMTQDRNVSASFSINRYTLLASAVAGGSATGSGTFDWNSSVPITATSNVGYQFTGWVGAGITNPADANTTILMTQDRNASATFLINSYNLSVATGTSGGGVTPSGSHNHGTQASITATPQTGYSFIGWSGVGIADLNATTTTVDMTKDRNVSASFAINRHTLLASAGTGGSVTGAGIFDWNSSVPITATPDAEYLFTGWSGTGINDLNSTLTTVDMTQDRNVTAIFQLKNYDLNVTASTGGTATGSGTFQHGTDANITATPSPGYHFTGWGGSGVADPNSTITTISVTQSRSTSANFAINQYNLIVSAGPNGTTIGSGTFSHGAQATISATPEAGYEFAGWIGAGISDVNASTTTIHMTQDGNISASFAIRQFTLTLTATEGGSVTGSGTYDYNSTTIIGATPNLGYDFTGWTGAGVSNSSEVNATVHMTIDRNVTANFQVKTYLLTIASTGGGSAIGTGTFAYGTDANISATPATGYVFAGWTGDGVADLNSSVTSVNVTQDRNVSAAFTPQVFQLQLSSTIGGSTTGDGNFSYGSSAPITAVADIGYFFTGWTGGGISDASSSSTNVSITQDRNVSANFELVPANWKILQTFASPIGSGSTSGGGTYEENSSVTLSATPAAGFQFLGWSVSGGTLTSPLSPNSAMVALDLNSDANATAHFSPVSHRFDISASTGGSISGDGNYSHGETVSIMAAPATGYSFSEWEVNGTIAFAVSTAPRQFDSSVNAFLINDQESPPLTLARGNTYQFVLDGNTTTNHPFYLSTDASSGGNTYAGEYLDGVTNSRATNGTVSITVSSGAPSTLYFHCGNHPGMGNVIHVMDATSLIDGIDLATTTVDLNASFALRANFSLNQHVLTVNSGTGGSATGSGTFPYGTDANLTATPEVGYAFAGWTGTGIASPTVETTTLTVNGDTIVTANFEVAQHTLSLSSTPQEGGSAGGSGTYAHGTTASISAIPSTGYRFINWLGGSPTDANASSTNQVLTSPATLSAVFEKLAYSVTTTVSPVDTGSTTGSGTHLHGDSFTVTATPAPGYQFEQWTGTAFASPNSSTQTISATGNLALYAVFSPRPIQVNAFASGPGTVIGSQASAYGQTVSVQAMHSDGASFFGWQVTGATINNPSSVSPDLFLDDNVAEVNATAFFAANPHKLVLSTDGNHSTLGSGTYESGSSVSISATPEVGHQLSGWELNGTVEYEVAVASRQLSAGQNAYYIDNRESPDLTLVRGITYRFNLDGNTTSAHPFFLTTGDDNASGYADEFLNNVSGSRSTSGFLTFTADESTPDSLRYRCGNHSGMGGILNVIALTSLPTPNSPVITIHADLSLQAKFTLKNHLLSVLAGEGGTVSGNGTFAYGTDANVTAEPNLGYVFNGWTGPSVVSPTSASTHVHLTDDTNVTANFVKAQYSLNLNTQPQDGGEVAGEGQFEYDTSNTITAIPATGYQFIGWSGGTPADVNGSSTTISLTANTVLTANFEKIKYEVSVIVEPLGAASVSGTGYYELDDNVSLAVTPIKGYVFSHWSGAIFSSPSSQTQDINVTDHVTLTVTLERHADAGTLSYALDATEVEAGWQESSWFGHFHQTSPNWAYHYDFGWIFTQPENDSSMWFWTQRLGWLWTNKDVYPHVWSQNTYEWNFFSRLPDGRFAYYNYLTSSWESIATTYEIMVVSFPGEGGTISGGGIYEEGSTAVLQPTPAEGYIFKQWFGDASGTDSPLSTKATGDLIIYGQFIQSLP